MGRVEILILSWGPDAGWLSFCLRSIRRFVTGVDRVVVVYPDRDDTVLRPICEAHGAFAVQQTEPPPPLGHLAQNLAKCEADAFCPEAKYILHVDSDCVFTAPTDASCYFRDGKPILVRRRWEDAADANYWREPTRRALGWDPAFETMASSPLIYDARVYAATRKHVSDTHQMLFSDYVMKQKPTFPYGFCEHNTLGNFVMEKAPELVSVVTVPPFDGLPRTLRQLWSHDDMRPDMREWLEEMLVDGEKRPPPAQGGMTAERRRLLGLG